MMSEKLKSYRKIKEQLEEWIRNVINNLRVSFLDSILTVIGCPTCHVSTVLLLPHASESLIENIKYSSYYFVNNLPVIVQKKHAISATISKCFIEVFISN